jgi:large subunit ribosomal protein L19
MSQATIQHVEKKQLKSDLPKLAPGDTVDVHVRIIEGSKERIQVFNGVVIGIAGSGITQNVTVRRIVDNEGVERTFPLHSPKIAKIEVKRHGHVRRSKLYYLRERVGKKRRLRDRRRGLGNLVETAEATATPAPETAAAPAAAQA